MDIPLQDPCVRSGVQQQPLLQALGTREPGMTVQLRVLHALDLDPPLHIEGFDTLFPSQPSPEMLPFLTELHLGGWPFAVVVFVNHLHSLS